MMKWLVCAAALAIAAPGAARTTFQAHFDFDVPALDYESNGVTIRTNDAADGSVSAFYIIDTLPIDTVVTRLQFDASDAAGWFGRTREFLPLDGGFTSGHVVVVPDQPLHFLYFGTDTDTRLDNLTLTLVSGVPEPADWALMAAGLGLAGLASRTRRGMAFMRA